MTEKGGTWALRLGQVAGDDLPDAGGQVARLTVLGRVLHTKGCFQARPQDAALQCLWGKREGLWGTWVPGLGGQEQSPVTREVRALETVRKPPTWREACELECPTEGHFCVLPAGWGRRPHRDPENQTPQPTHKPQQGDTECWGLQSRIPRCQQRSPQPSNLGVGAPALCRALG